MGTDAADYDGTGRPSLVIGNFSNEMMAPLPQRGHRASSSTRRRRPAVGQATLLTLTFACFFFDYDLDGRLDIFAANGHVADDIQPCRRTSPTRSRRTCSATPAAAASATRPAAGPDLARPMVGRGAAYADYDGDGDLDVVVTTNGGPARLFRNLASARAVRVQVKGCATGPASARRCG